MCGNGLPRVRVFTCGALCASDPSSDYVLRISGEGMPHHNFPSDKGVGTLWHSSLRQESITSVCVCACARRSACAHTCGTSSQANTGATSRLPSAGVGGAAGVEALCANEQW